MITTKSPSPAARVVRVDETLPHQGTEQKEPTLGSSARPERTGGLCINCERRLDCTFPIPEGGVFQCEEYE